jgi:hypothetical protein
MNQKNIRITYSFKLPDGTTEDFKLELDAQTLTLLGNVPEKLPSWTKLNFHKCPHCPLDAETDPHCPLAANLASIVDRFNGILSYDRVHVDVTTDERVSSQETSAQRAISSVMGLVMATSGCPYPAFMRPMARFHLPMATSEETMFRASSMYLLAQFFLKQHGHPANLELDGLVKIYADMQLMNQHVLERIRAATDTDSSVNAVIVLDVYAKTLELVVKKALEQLRYLFEPYFEAAAKMWTTDREGNPNR